MVYSTDRSKAVVPLLILLFLTLWFTIRVDFLSLVLCYFVLVFFSPFSIAITSLGKECAFRTFLSIFACLVLSVSSSSSSLYLGGAAACDCGTPWTFLLPFFCYNIPVVLFDIPGISTRHLNTLFLLSPHLRFIISFICDLFVVCLLYVLLYFDYKWFVFHNYVS